MPERVGRNPAFCHSGRNECGVYVRALLDGYGFHGNEPARSPAIRKLYFAIDLGEESIVTATAHVEARLQFSASLADDDGATGDDLPGEELHSKPLGIGIAAVFGAA
jgi:hypothetical protein